MRGKQTEIGNYEIAKLYQQRDWRAPVFLKLVFPSLEAQFVFSLGLGPAPATRFERQSGLTLHTMVEHLSSRPREFGFLPAKTELSLGKTHPILR